MPLLLASDEIDAEVERHLFGSCPPWHAPRRYTHDTYAQALLVNHLERLGFTHRFASPLEFELESGRIMHSRCSRIDCPASGRAFICYAATEGDALVGAALLALRAGLPRDPPPSRSLNRPFTRASPFRPTMAPSPEPLCPDTCSLSQPC